MRWIGDWWGITLVAETEGDKILLKSLLSLLPEKPRISETYGFGKLETKTEEAGEFRLIFNR